MQIFDIFIKSELDIGVWIYIQVLSSIPLPIFSLLQNHAIFISISLQWNLKSGVMMLQAVFRLFCTICLSWAFFVHTNFKFNMPRIWNFRMLCQNEISRPHPLLPRFKHCHIRGDWKITARARGRGYMVTLFSGHSRGELTVPVTLYMTYARSIQTKWNHGMWIWSVNSIPGWGNIGN